MTDDNEYEAPGDALMWNVPTFNKEEYDDNEIHDGEFALTFDTEGMNDTSFDLSEVIDLENPASPNFIDKQQETDESDNIKAVKRRPCCIIPFLLLMGLAMVGASVIYALKTKPFQSSSANSSNDNATPLILISASPTVSPDTVAPSQSMEPSVSSSPSLSPTTTPSIPPSLSLTPTVFPSSVPSTAPTATPTVYDCTLPSGNQTRMQPLIGKKGIGFTLREEGLPGSWVQNIPRIQALNTSWNYAWGVETVEAQPATSEFLPMIWGGKNLDRVQSRIDEMKPLIEDGTIKRILGFNEPDVENQSNMTVQQVSDAWSILDSAGVPLVSPSVGHIEGEWLPEFVETARENCHRYSWIGVHWYGGPNIDQFQDRLTELHELYQRPILITEFAPADWNAETVADNRFTRRQVLNFMKQALPWLEETEWIAGYAWFPFEFDSPVGTASNLFTWNDELSALGRYYASVTSENPSGDQSITL